MSYCKRSYNDSFHASNDKGLDGVWNGLSRESPKGVTRLNKLAADMYNFTLIGYAFLYYIGEILRTPTQNLLYIYMGML